MRSPGTNWRREPPADSDSIQRLVAEAPVTLPTEYLEFLKFSNGGEGPLGVAPGWFVIWPAEEVMECNVGYRVFQRLSGFFGFGSNAGGELFAFDTSSPPRWQVVRIPFIPLEEGDAIVIADSFASFMEAMGRELEDSAG